MKMSMQGFVRGRSSGLPYGSRCAMLMTLVQHDALHTGMCADFTALACKKWEFLTSHYMQVAGKAQKCLDPKPLTAIICGQHGSCP